MTQDTARKKKVPTPICLLVGLDDWLVMLCSQIVSEAGLSSLQAAHVAAASERIPVVLPKLVVVDAGVREKDFADLNDCCVAVGAEVIRLTPTTSSKELVAALQEGATNAMIKALREQW